MSKSFTAFDLLEWAFRYGFDSFRFRKCCCDLAHFDQLLHCQAFETFLALPSSVYWEETKIRLSPGLNDPCSGMDSPHCESSWTCCKEESLHSDQTSLEAWHGAVHHLVTVRSLFDWACCHRQSIQMLHQFEDDRESFLLLDYTEPRSYFYPCCRNFSVGWDFIGLAQSYQRSFFYRSHDHVPYLLSRLFLCCSTFPSSRKLDCYFC